jgi:Ca-activated chloride channel family protein
MFGAGRRKIPVFVALLICFNNLLIGSAQRQQRISLTALVTNDEGKAVPGLKQSDFIVSEGKSVDNIVSFTSADEAMSIGIVIDKSGSMQAASPRDPTRRRLELLSKALLNFVAQGNPGNEYFVMAFDSNQHLLRDWTTRQNIGALAGLEMSGKTAFFDGCYAAIQKLNQGRFQRRAIILISDGKDTESRHSFAELRDVVRRSDILIYSLTILDADNYSGSLSAEGKEILTELSSLSGGQSFFPRVGWPVHQDQINGALEQIASELRHLYVLGISPILSDTDSSWHKVKVKLNSGRGHGSLSVRVRSGYYAN